MNTTTKWIAAGALAAVLAGGGATIAGASGGDDSEGPIPAGDLDRASAAALEAVPGGTVTETEVGDEDSFYEVEVTKDGKEVDVQLDSDFRVVGIPEVEDGSEAGEEEGEGTADGG